MHTQRKIKISAAKGDSNFFVRMTTFGFVEDDKLDVRNVGEQLCFCFADDPRYFRIRTVVLNATNDSQSMACVADCREANDTKICRLLF